MVSEENLQAVIEVIIYVAPEPVDLRTLSQVLEGVETSQIQCALDKLIEKYQSTQHGMEIRRVAGGYKFSSKAEFHEVIRKFVKSLKPPVRLSRQALETLAVLAYRQPATLPEIQEIRGVDAGGVIKNLLEKKLVAPSGRKQVIGRPILYRTTRNFLIQFGLNDLGELPSLKEFEELARASLGKEALSLEVSPSKSSQETPQESTENA